MYVDSAGTSGFHSGSQPDTRTQANALKHGIDLSELKARPFQANDFDTFDKIYVMDRSNLFNVLELAKNETQRSKVELLLDLLPDVSNKEVPDPYYGGENGFELVYQLVDRATDEIIKELQKNEK